MKIGKKKWMLFAAIMLICFTAAGTTYARMHQQTKEVKNQFKSGIVNIAIEEEFQQGSALPKDGTKVKKSVYIKNTFDGKEVLKDRIVPVYIRAELVPQWKNEKGELLPVDKNSIAFTYNEDTAGWIQGDDGYFYYTKVVKPEEKTTELLASVSVRQETKDSIPKGAHLEVQVLADAVQAAGNAKNETWGIVKAGGKELSFQ